VFRAKSAEVSQKFGSNLRTAIEESAAKAGA
jgi:hypothetical protein